MKKLLIILISSLFIGIVNADNKILDEKIERFCFEHKMAKNYEFEDNNGTRCTLILQALYRFETGNLRSYTGNNIFNFRSPTLKEKWKNLGATGIRNGFITFQDRTSSIIFAVDRYYKYDYRKTISQIIGGGCYYNLKNQYVCFDGFTHTVEDHKNYINYVKKYYGNNSTKTSGNR